MLQLNTTEMLLELDLAHTCLEIEGQEANLERANAEIGIGNRLLRDSKTDLLKECAQDVLISGRKAQRLVAQRLSELHDQRIELLNALLLINEDLS